MSGKRKISLSISESLHECTEAEQLIALSPDVVVRPRRKSLTAPPSPLASRGKRSRTLMQHNFGYMSHLHNIINWQHLWGSPESNSKHNLSLHRSESMVSLSCFRTLSSFVTEDNLSGLQNYLATNKNVSVDDRDENGVTALMLACESASASPFVRVLLNAGADPTASDTDGWTPLAHVARNGDVALARDLLDRGAPVDSRDMGGWTPLMWASYKGHEEMVDLLIERGADPNAYGNFNISSVVWAAGRGHGGVVKSLIAAGGRAATCDKYGTTALTWASRAGCVAAVATLLAHNAPVDAPGIRGWTPLIVAAKGNHFEIVQMLLEHKPNVNALDKDGMSALAIACKEGFYDIAVALLNSGAYINIQDHSKDTCLIHAVKGGHKAIVEALLKKYVDVDLPGKEKKTAVYTAVEKGHVSILKLLLQANPDLEVVTKSGDTALLKAVRNRSAEMVQMLLDRKARVHVADRRGDTALHIAMRARSKQIVEILLRNPKNSQLLYKPNKSQETPYNIDMSYPKTILGQIFGARKLNTSEESERLLGYELYSAALADMLAGPGLAVPITVGLYARWGSGKSFLLAKLKEEMMRVWSWEWNVEEGAWWHWWWWSLHACALFGALLLLSGLTTYTALAVSGFLAVLLLAILHAAHLVGTRLEWYWLQVLMTGLNRKFNSLKLILQVVFCHPPGPQNSQNLPSHPIRFHFTEQAKSGTQEGEWTVIQTLCSMNESIEEQHGKLVTRLARAFRPRPRSNTSDWKWRRVCCVPHIVAFEFCLLCALIGMCVLFIYLTQDDQVELQHKQIQQAILGAAAGVVGISLIANLYTCGRVAASLLLPPRLHLQRAAKKRPDAVLHALRPHVEQLVDTVSCLDAFTGQRTRMVVVVDALDSCEQDRVLTLLNCLHSLCCEPGSPFIIILAIDPHIISKAVEVSSRRAFSESNIGGWDYLRNMVQLPFYLQNSALRKVKIAQQTALKRMQMLANNDDFTATLQRSVSARRLSSTSEVMSSQERIKPTKESIRSKRLKPSESVASSVASGLHRIGGGGGAGGELGRVLLTDDYFSDVNPRSVKRLMNVLYITGRLLKAFQIEFNWYQLASWVNLTEQWPFRTSWMIYHHDMCGEHIDDTTPLKNIYDKIKPHIPTMKGTEPLMELDRDERKLEAFLSYHVSSLLVADLKVFLPFTINLDPYIKKVIKEEQQQTGNEAQMVGSSSSGPQTNTGVKLYNRRHVNFMHQIQKPGGVVTLSTVEASPEPDEISRVPVLKSQLYHFLGDIDKNIRLSALNVEEVSAELTKRLPDVAKHATDALKQQNICGMVLAHCDLNELKQVLNLPFGDWEMFKMWINSLREIELNMPLWTPKVNVVADTSPETDTDGPPAKTVRSTVDMQRSRPSVLEKQVTLEEQMICGALQTLSEEVGDENAQDDGDSDIQFVLPRSPTAPGLLHPTSGSFRNNKKHQAINHDKYEIENEIEPNGERLTFNIDRTKRNENSVEYKKRRSSETRLPSPFKNRVQTQSGMYEQNSKHNSIMQQKNYEGTPYFLAPQSPTSVQRSKSVSISRPTSLYITDDSNTNQPNDRSATTEESTIAAKIKNELIKKVNSVERLTKLKDKFRNKTSSADRTAPATKLESDDESTPLVSSELSSATSSSKVQSPEVSRANDNTDSSSSLNCPRSKNKIDSPRKKRKKNFGLECNDFSFNDDNTKSSEFSPISDRSILESSCNELDMLPVDKSINKVSPISNRLSVSEGSLSNMLEPYNVPLLSSGVSDMSLKSSLWRQDAIEDDEDWNSPESAV